MDVILVPLPLYVLRYSRLTREFIGGRGTEYKAHSDSLGFDLSNSFACTRGWQQPKHKNFVIISVLVKEAPTSFNNSKGSVMVDSMDSGPTPGFAVTYCVTLGKLFNLAFLAFLI